MAIVTTSMRLADLAYAQGEIIIITNGATLTVDATPVIRPGTIQCTTVGKLLITNSSPTTPLIFNLDDMDNDFIFRASGVMEVRGQPMALGSGTGAEQSWDFSTLYGGAIRHMTYVEVQETPGGPYMPWPVIHEDPKFVLNCGLLATTGGATRADFTAGNTKAGQVLFWNETTRVLRTGDGVNGAVIPAGCAVRIPNIYISNRLVTNASRAISMETSGTPTGGTFTLTITRENGTVLGTTAPIAFNATAAAIDTAIEAVTGANTVTSSGGALPTAVNIVWAGTYANERLAMRVGTDALTGGTNPHLRLFETNALNMSLITLNPLGTLDAEWVSFSDKIRFSSDVFKKVRLIAVGTGSDICAFSAANGSLEVDGLSHVQSPFAIVQIPGFSIIFGPTSFKRIVSLNKAPVIALSLQALPALTGNVDRIVSGFFGKRSATNNRSYQILNLPAGQKFTNHYWIGAQSNFGNLTSPYFVNYGYADGTLNVQDATQVTPVINASNIVDGIFANYTDAGPMNARSLFFNGDFTCKNNRFLGGVSDARNQVANFAFMGSSEVSFDNWQISSVRTGPLVDLPASFLANKLTIRKMFVTFATAESAANIDACQDGVYDLVAATPNGVNENFNGVRNFVGGNYADPGLSPTTGHLTFGPFGDGAGLALTGGAYTDGVGGLFMPFAGDTATITLPFAAHGITSFQNTLPRLFVDLPGAAANVAVVQAPGAPTGGTFTLTIADSSGTVLGTTAALAFNASTAAVDTAIEAIPGVGTGVTVTGSLTAGYVITFPTGQVRIVTVNGAALTGGTEPGIAYAVGRARLLTGTETLGAAPPVEFAVRVPAGAWSAWQALTGPNLAASIAALTGYAPGGAGLEARLRVTASQTNPLTKLNQISLLTNIDPSLWSLGDASFTLSGPGPTDVTRVLRASDSAVLYQFTGSGVKEFAVGANFDVPVYFQRLTSGGVQLMTTFPATQRINFGPNGVVNLFYGSEVQLAQVSVIETLPSSLATIPGQVWSHGTRQLTGIADANIKQVNSVTVGGVGTAGNPWGPV